MDCPLLSLHLPVAECGRSGTKHLRRVRHVGSKAACTAPGALVQLEWEDSINFVIAKSPSGEAIALARAQD